MSKHNNWCIQTKDKDQCKLFTKLSRLMTKPETWLCPATTQISLGIHPVWSVRSALNGLLRTQAFIMWTAKTLTRLGIVFAGHICHFVSFVMRWLRCLWWRKTSTTINSAYIAWCSAHQLLQLKTLFWTVKCTSFHMFTTLPTVGKFLNFLCPPPKGRGHIILGVVPIGGGVSVCMTLSCLHYLMNQWVDFN